MLQSISADGGLARLGAPDGAPVLICGMAGARQGWTEAPYLKPPRRLDALHEGAIRVDVAGDIRICRASPGRGSGCAVKKRRDIRLNRGLAAIPERIQTCLA